MYGPNMHYGLIATDFIDEFSMLQIGGIFEDIF